MNGNPCAYQYLNLMHKAWHAGKANSTSLGIDICQQPTVKWLKHYQDRDYQIQVIDNPSSRGSSKCLSLDPRIGDQLRKTIDDLCSMFDIPKRAPRTDQVLDDWKSFRGVLGHHHISHKKWDCAPWWSDVTKDLTLV